MNVSYPVKSKVKMAWGGITLPLKEGTPVSSLGAIANTKDAIGLVADTHTFVDGAEVEIYVGGSVALAEVEAKSGLTLAAAAMLAMDGIDFRAADGTTKDKYKYVLPEATATAIGGVKLASNVIAGDDDTDALKAVLVALKAAGIMAADPVTE